ncbi:hypothetical protein RND81_04G196400 [Saponaria officinalis]|uniref:Uncharacterized protein n=1 Tax=Saponaria officinalis TaxID=3572 RepID=A0AAW1LN27_SAPOF
MSITQTSLSDVANSETIPRKTANYHPSLWGDFFMTFTCDHTNMDKLCEESKILKEKVRNMVKEDLNSENIGEKLEMIDAIERLGIGYHFEKEIEELLHNIFKIYNSNHQQHYYHLQIVALLFRLLRQHGINISSDVFNKFNDNEGKFNKAMKDDIEGIVSLYEATYLRLHGEIILEEAHAFTKPILESQATHDQLIIKPYLRKLVTHAIHRPLRKSLPRVATWDYISIYQLNDMHDVILLKFAKIDFNLLQIKHVKELCTISKWWKDLEVEKNFPFARDRIVELYLWILGVYYEPQYELARKFICKVIAICSILDDIYDVYGTPLELQLLTQAIQRWDSSAEDELPAEYMKIIFREMVKVYREMEEELSKEGRSFAVTYAKEEMKKGIRAFLEESKWLVEKKIPSVEEYLRVACVSTCYPMLCVASLVGMGELATKDAFDWFVNGPPIINSSALICRLMDDIVSHQLEREREHVPSGVECYMNEHKVGAKEAYETFKAQIENAWVDINEAFMDPNAPPIPLLTRVLNFARVIDLLYKHEDAYTHPHNTKHLITSLFVNPLPI